MDIHTGNYRKINVQEEEKDQNSVLSFYKKLISLRKEKKVISDGKIEFLFRKRPEVLAYRRFYGNEELIVLNNLTDQEYVLRVNTEGYRKLLGNYEGVKAGNGQLTLRPYETTTLEKIQRQSTSF